MQQRNTAGGMRPQQTRDLDNLDAQVDDAVPFIKSYIHEKFGPKDGPTHYAEFGFEHRTAHGYELPGDRQKRGDALRMMTEAIAANGIGTKTYGTTF